MQFYRNQIPSFHNLPFSSLQLFLYDALKIRKLTHAGRALLAQNLVTGIGTFMTTFAVHMVCTAMAVIFTLSLFLVYKHQVTKGSASVKDSEGIHALTKVLSPTRSIWPVEYITLSKAGVQHGKRISLPLGMILRDILDGKLQFRNPKDDLQYLVRGKIEVDGWIIEFTPSTDIWIKATYWMLKNDIPSFLFDPKPLAKLHDARARTTTSSPLDVTIGSLESLVSHLERANISGRLSVCSSLAYVPRPHLEAYILETQKAFHSNAQTQLLVDFTSCESPLLIGHDLAVLAIIPFLPRTNSQRRICRTPIALLTPLHRIIELFTSGPHALSVLRVENVSVAAIAGLNQVAETLEKNFGMRNDYIEEAGMRGWREEVLHAHWEAALFKAEVLTRCSIVLEKKQRPMQS